MSLAIDATRVQYVLLAGEAHGEHDGWWEVADESFAIGAFEFVDDLGNPLGDLDAPGPLGFSFVDFRGTRVCGPLTSILAVRYEQGES